MRITSWNCLCGDVSRRLSDLAPLRSDLITLQECRRPASDSASVIWRGDIPYQGVAVVSTEATRRLEFVEIPKLHPTVVPVRVQAPQPFVFVVVWTHPPYNAVAWAAMTVCRWSRPATSIARQACRASSATPSGSCSACGMNSAWSAPTIIASARSTARRRGRSRSACIANGRL